MNKNNEVIDVLDEDKPISGQKFVCVSFLSPEKILKRKELFYFEEFLKYYDFTTAIKKYHAFLNFVAYKYNMNFDDLMGDFEEFVKSEKDTLKSTTIDDEYATFIDNESERLDEIFTKENHFQTNVRALKIRGTFPTQEEAELRCKLLREQDPNHDIYVGPVGVWMPWDPDAYKTGRVEHMEKELNQLMNEKMNNERKAKEHFDQRVKETKKQAIEENVKLAEKSNNKLTQNVDEEGNLYGVEDGSTVENAIVSGNDGIVTSEDIKKELFESSDVNTARTKND